ncbi:MAG: PQQ-dependent sugar dehydrogenase [Nevskiales bacterium]
MSAIAGCGGGSDNDPPPSAPSPEEEITFRRTFARLSFINPLILTAAPGSNAQLYVATQSGRIFSFENTADPAQAPMFLDLSSRVTQRGGEEGLLGMAFHPDFQQNRQLYVYYTPDDDPRRSRISRFLAPTATAADAASEQMLLEFPQPFANHNGGVLTFGPDGMLYVGSGDGGSANDPQNNAQTLSNLLGKILRLTPGGGIPADNPFVANASARGEIWAFGLRNPFRISFDRASGELWAGDVGQGAREEIDLIEKGANYGWRVYEGTRSNINPDNLPLSNFTAPVFEYDHSGDNCSITGGYVYRGTSLPGQSGRYFYADFCSGRVWGLRRNPGSVTNSEVANVSFPSSFGEDAQGELYITSFDGGIYRLVAP